MELEQLRFPVGKFEYGKTYNTNETRKHIKDIADLPKKVKKICKKLSNIELDTPYRDGGWTIRQVVHHLADSHINAYIRTKLMLTEANPTIKPYSEEVWAETEDGKNGSIKMSLRLLSAVHLRWMAFLESLTEEDFHKTYYHPGSNRVFTLAEVMALYSWHGKHHLGHIKIVSGGKRKKVKKAKIKKVMIVGQVEKKEKEEKTEKPDKKHKANDAVIIIPAKSLKSDPPVILPTKSKPVVKPIATKPAPKAVNKTVTKTTAKPVAAKSVAQNAKTTVAKPAVKVAKATPMKPKTTTAKVSTKVAPVKKATRATKSVVVQTETNPTSVTTSADGRITTTTSKVISTKTIVPKSTDTK
jgi:uncharacterized damage-inducible protein DinB